MILIASRYRLEQLWRLCNDEIETLEEFMYKYDDLIVILEDWRDVCEFLDKAVDLTAIIVEIHRYPDAELELIGRSVEQYEGINAPVTLMAMTKEGEHNDRIEEMGFNDTTAISNICDQIRYFIDRK